MYAQQLGLVSSWKMMTRDKGWVKPLLILALIGWIPVVGKIVLLGYGLEWARLTAWGVDAAPKQRGIAYGKLLRTGAIAFLVILSIGIALAVVNALILNTSLLRAIPLGTGVIYELINRLFDGASLVSTAIVLPLNLIVSAFTLAAAMRATLYDSFVAGWRLDRLIQMIERDLGGFVHVCAVALLGAVVGWAYSAVVTLAVDVLEAGTVLAPALGISRYVQDLGSFLTSAAPGIIVMAVALWVLIAFLDSVISVAVQLITINAIGQWFCRFEVGRWGVSSAPLPEGAPSPGAGENAG